MLVRLSRAVLLDTVCPKVTDCQIGYKLAETSSIVVLIMSQFMCTKGNEPFSINEKPWTLQQKNKYIFLCTWTIQILLSLAFYNSCNFCICMLFVVAAWALIALFMWMPFVSHFPPSVLLQSSQKSQRNSVIWKDVCTMGLFQIWSLHHDSAWLVRWKYPACKTSTPAHNRCHVHEQLFVPADFPCERSG